MIQILENVFAVEVPKDAFNFHDTKANGIIWEDTLGYYDSFYFDDVDEDFGNYEILGTITPTEIDFDVEPMVELDENSLPKLTMYKDYTYEMWPFKHPEGSFRSALTAAGITQYDKLVILQKL